ncbi:hypothetical protein Tco_0323488 [Tanacetum coccineum]
MRIVITLIDVSYAAVEILRSCCGDSAFMLWNSLLLLECSRSSYFAAVSILKLTLPTGRYVVPTGRVIATDSVIVATSGYVVPAAYDISPGRVK